MRADAGRASCARKADSTLISQGTARIFGREITSMVSISRDNQTRWPLPDRHVLSC
jgi:hypothetical protein